VIPEVRIPADTAMTHASASLVERVTPPLIPSLHVERGYLSDVLDVAARRPLTIVVAPGGYGKSSMVAGWLARSPIRGGWLHLSELERQPVAFAHGLVVAARAVGFTIGTSCESLLRLTDPNPAALAMRLADDFSLLEAPVVLVLDDYHLASSPGTDEFLGHLVIAAPPTLRIMVLSRIAPDLPYARLRSRGVITEIGPDQLRLDEAETAAMLASSGVKGSSDVAHQVFTLTSGWPVAVQLAAGALAMHRTSDTGESDMLHNLSAAKDPIRFLVDDMLTALPERLADVWRHGAILSRITASRLGAVMAVPVSSELAADLKDLAVRHRVLSSTGPGVFQMHEVFREALLANLTTVVGQAEIARAHERASAAYDMEGATLEAISHAVIANRPDIACGLVSKHADIALTDKRVLDVAAWLSALPEEWISGNPRMLAARIEVETIRGSLVRALEDTGRLIALVRDPAAPPHPPGGPMDRLEAEGFGIRFLTTFFTPHELIDLADRVLDEVPADRTSVRSDAMLWGPLIRQMLGRSPEALDVLERAAASPRNASSYMQAHAHWSATGVHFYDGRLIDAARAADRMLEVAGTEAASHVLANAHATRGLVAMEMGHLDEAATHFARALEMDLQASVHAELESTLGLALVLQVTGQPAAAMAHISRLLGLANDASDYLLGAVVESCAARLAVMRGDRDTAETWLRERWSPEAPHRFSSVELPVLTAAQVMITGDGARAEDGLALVRGWLSDPVNQCNHRWRLRATLLEALGLAKTGDRAAAAARATQALSQPTFDGHVWPILEFQAALLELPVGRDRRTAALRQRITCNGVVVVVPPGSPESGTTELIQPSTERLRSAMRGYGLTNRELEILAHISTGMTNREIAQALGISVRTVNTHTGTLLRRLGVPNRLAAAVLAGERGGLGPAGD